MDKQVRDAMRTYLFLTCLSNKHVCVCNEGERGRRERGEERGEREGVREGVREGGERGGKRERET